MQKGFENEKEFAKLIDNKKINQLSIDLQEMIYALFKNVKKDDYVECWQSKFFEKADIKIRINGEIKGISIKTGRYCSMHQETINTFYPFLRKIGIENNIISKFNDYMLGIVKGQKVDSTTYIFNNYNSIKDIHNKINEYSVKINLILRFIFQGTEIQKYGCDAIILGTPNNFLWGIKDEILEYLVNYPKEESIFLKFSALNIKNYDRNLRNNVSRNSKEKHIQVKWYTIKEDLENIKKLRNYKLKN